jgi:hypothetical protein
MTFLIGHFFDNSFEMNEAYSRHSEIITRFPEIGCVNSKEHSVTELNRKHVYYLVDERGRWKQRIQGLVYQGVFANVKHLSDRHYIMSRFRPR